MGEKYGKGFRVKVDRRYGSFLLGANININEHEQYLFICVGPWDIVIGRLYKE